MSFAIALSQRLRELEAIEEEHDKGWWYPSQMSFCDRSAILKHAGIEEVEFDDISLRRFWLGNVIHEAIQGMNPYKVVGHELRVRDEEYKVSGRLDTLSVTPDDILEVQEYKSINSRSFSYSDLPKPEHILQLAVYLTFKAEGQDRLPDRGRLIYISKDDLRIEEYILVLTPELEEQVKSKLLRLEELYQEYTKTGALPAPLEPVVKVSRGKERTEPAWQTRFCGYRGTGKCCGDK